MISRIISIVIAVAAVMNITACAPPQHDYPIKPIPFNKVQLEDQFWLPRLKTQAKVTVPFALDKTRPAVENLEKCGNFIHKRGGKKPFPHRFVSSDLYKVMEGAAYILTIRKDPELEKRMDKIIDIIADAQKKDGYLYVAHICGIPNPREMGKTPYSWIVHSHELYNMGHMYEGAIAYYRATGKDKWLKVAEKSANHFNKVIFQGGDPSYNGGKAIMQAPGHQELELALCRLYRATGKRLYLDMAKKFIDIRGRTYRPDGKGVMSPTYAQQHKPVVKQSKAVGHAVRAAYMYAGIADVCALTGDKSYIPALDRIWHNITDKKMHITGGLGAVHGIEGFGPDYILPNKDAYNETCAAVANVFFNLRMFLLHKDAKYLDVAEVSLLNNSLAGVNMEGNKFFYVNPLEADGVKPFNHGTAGRSPWFGCACCPSNIARLMPQISGYMYAHTDDEIYVALYAGNSTTVPLAGGAVAIKQETLYPFDGKVTIKLTPKNKQKFAVKLRIPTWAREKFVPGELYSYVNKPEGKWTVKVNGDEVETAIEKGFATIDRTWTKGDTVELNIPMKTRFNTCVKEVWSNRDRVAITRGPLVYCAEEVDNSGLVQRFFLKDIPATAKVKEETLKDGVLKNVVRVAAPAGINEKGKISKGSVKLVPYYAWNNRGDKSMIVWIPRKPEMAKIRDFKTTGGKFKSVKCSFSLKDGMPGAISDGKRPKTSNDKNTPCWTSWPQRGMKQFIDIDLGAEKKIRSISVYWRDDNDHVRVPDSWKLKWRHKSKWRNFNKYITDSFGIEKDKYNVVHPEKEMTTDGIRIEMIPQNNKCVGIYDVDIVFEK